MRKDLIKTDNTQESSSPQILNILQSRQQLLKKLKAIQRSKESFAGLTRQLQQENKMLHLQTGSLNQYIIRLQKTMS